MTTTRNVKTVKIIVPCEIILRKVKTTPALNRLTRLNLQVGENIERVNHYQFSELMRIYPIAGCEVIEINQ